MKIENKNISLRSEPFIVAEMSGNRNQSLDRAFTGDAYAEFITVTEAQKSKFHRSIKRLHLRWNEGPEVEDPAFMTVSYALAIYSELLPDKFAL